MTENKFKQEVERIGMVLASKQPGRGRSGEIKQLFDELFEMARIPGHACVVMTAQSLEKIPDDKKRAAAEILNGLIDDTMTARRAISKETVVEVIGFIQRRKKLCGEYFDQKAFAPLDQRWVRLAASLA